jgi:PRTRC genetic system ThiF family protein
MYHLDNGFARYNFTVTVVGCGGTGGFVAEGLCRVLPQRASLVLVDHDRVEERNLGRQNFTHEDLGQFKSEALAKRLARHYRRAVGYSTLPIQAVNFQRLDIIVGCVDNGPARRAIEQKVKSRHTTWWIDCGNEENFGQVLIGSRRQGFDGCFDPETETCFALPLPTMQRPEILAEAPDGDCAGAVEAGEQSPVINQAMAALAVEVVRRLIQGTCPWMALYLDLEAGILSPVMAAPDNVARITRVRQRKLERR